jgi:hypothetical protein
MAALKKHILKHKISDYVISMFFPSRYVSHANLKAIDGAAPVYMYLFSWQSR